MFHSFRRRHSASLLDATGLAACLVILISADSSHAVDSHLDQRLQGDFEEHIIPIDGGQLCCVQRSGSGPTLILIPGTFSDSRVFGKVIPQLDESLNLLIVENRGLGKSWPPPENGSIEQCARDALRIADHLQVDTFYVGGHSLGGMISIELARVAPERLHGVISIEGWTHWHAARDAFNSDMKSTLGESDLEVMATYRQEVLQRWSTEQKDAFGRIWKQWDGQPALESTRLPVLELYGDRSRQPATRMQLRIPDRPNIELRWFENASHSLHYERPLEVADAINDFISRSEAKRTTNP